MRYLTLSSWLVISLNSLKLITITFLANLDNNLFVRIAYPDKLILSKFKYYPCNGNTIVSLKIYDYILPFWKVELNIETI